MVGSLSCTGMHPCKWHRSRLFLNERSRYRLTTKEGGFTECGQNVLDHTPMARFGEAEELLGTMNYLIDDAASGFVTEITITVDGGFLSSSAI